MKTQPLGKSSLVSSRLSYGNMRTVGTWDPQQVTPERMTKAVKSHVAAYEAGYTLFDTADIYCHGMCEIALGNALKQVSGMREKILVATKCGIRVGGKPNADSPQRYDFSGEYILWSIDQSLKRMGIETIDLFQLHRPDFLMNPPEIAQAFERAKKAGKVREFGVSNFSPSYVTTLAAFMPFPLAVNQVEIHLAHREPFTDGTLDQCIEKNITPLAYSPLGGGWLGAGRELPADASDRETRQKLLDVLDATATAHSVSRTVVALAWLMKHPSKIIPIVGSNTPAHITDAAKADDLDLTREEWYRILLAARGKALP